MSTDAQQLEAMAAAQLSQMKGMALGAPFLAVCCDSLLMGVILCQMTHWIPMAKHDVRHVRILVGIASIAALLGTAFTWSTYLLAFVYDFGSYSRFVSFDFLGWYGTLDMLIVIPVQLFFLERSYRINNKSLVVLAIGATMITATASMGIAVTITSRGLTTFTRTSTMLNLCTAWPAVCTSTHIWLTSSILYGLWASRSISQRANRLLTRLIVVSIESQLPATLVAAVMMLVIIVDNKSPVIPFIAVVHPKVFMVGLLAMVNLRHTWRLKGKVPTTYNSEPFSTRPTNISLGSTTETLSCHTPKADVDVMGLGRHPSGLSTLESGLALDTLRNSEMSEKRSPFE